MDERARGYLEHVLRSHVEITLAAKREFRGQAMLSAVVPTSRVILIARGDVEYHIESAVLALRRGDMLLVPAWTRRSWTHPAGKVCGLAWCEYVVQPPNGVPAAALWRRGVDVEIEAAALRRVAEAPDSLVAEAELKAILGRLIGGGRPLEARAEARTGVEGVIHEACAWLEANYHHPRAIGQLQDRCGLSANYLRDCFKRTVGMSARAYLTDLRMRAARYYLRESKRSVKQIALAVGYADALYFSRHYHAYWGTTPTADRSSART